MSDSPLQEEGNGEREGTHPQEDLDTREGQTEDQDQRPMDEDLYRLEVKEQDRWLPIANVARIMKTALPDNAKIAKEAKECMQECVSEFISFITSEASEKCQQEKRKTVNGEDILFAMTSLGFENYGEALKIYLARFRETHVSKTETTAKATNGQRGAVPVGESGDVIFDQPGALVGETDPVSLIADGVEGISTKREPTASTDQLPSSLSQGLIGEPGPAETGSMGLTGGPLVEDDIGGAGLAGDATVEGGSYGSYDV